MIWCTIDKDYISFLKKYDSRIPNIDYGNNGYKPFLVLYLKKTGLYMWHKFLQRNQDI